ncbi:MAG: FKBP-type peptidyl-prolyl cis-trans isomerase [Candidatus Hydrogenedentales bacterium]
MNTRHVATLFVAACALALPSFAQDAAAPAGLETEIQKVSYIIGSQFGKSLKTEALEADLKALTQGIQDALEGKKPAISAEDSQKIMSEFEPKLVAKQKEAQQKAGAANLAEGEAFLAENGKKPGVQTTETGLQYIVVKEGTGEMPKATDTVKTHYRGTLINGEQFDSSYDRNEPAEFPVNRVIPGWTEILQKMKVGSNYKVFVPSKLAYGEKGARGAIPPNATLIFDVELLEIVKQPETIAVPTEPIAVPK